MKNLWVVAVILLTAGYACGQSLGVKPGLWENVVYGDDGKPMLTSLDCYTPTSLLEAIGKVSQHPGCTMTAKSVTSRGATVDVSCTMKSVQMSSHGVLEVIDSGHIRSTTIMKMTMKGKTTEMTGKAEARFKTASCGDIKPNAPQIISK